MTHPKALRRLRPVARTGFHCALLAGVLVTGAASSEAQPAVKQVLVLQSFDRGILVLDHFTGDFRVNLTSAPGDP